MMAPPHPLHATARPLVQIVDEPADTASNYFRAGDWHDVLISPNANVNVRLQTDKWVGPQGDEPRHSNRPSLRCALRNWYMGSRVRDLSKEVFGEDEGSHATPSEVALSYFGYPEDGARVSQAALDPDRAPTGVIYDADDYRRNFPDGRIGSNPGRANAEIGERIFNAAVEDLIDDYRDFIDKA